MAYKIKVFTGGLMKLDVIENGEKIRRKLRLGEVVEVEDVDEGEMEAGYYRIIRPELSTSSSPKIKREPQKILQPNGQQAQQLTELIDGMKTMIGVAETVLGAINKEEQPEQKETILIPVKDKDGKEIRSDYTISENESEKDIYDQKSFREGNEQYQRLVENTAVFMMGGQTYDSNGRKVRNIHKIGDIYSKKIPKVSEAMLGKMERKSIPALLDSKGEIANKNNPGTVKIKVVTDEKDRIDVVKTLGLKLVNKPGQGFNIDRGPENGNNGGGIDI